MSQSPFSISGRTALVTGGAKGIGRACAEALAAAGAKVIIADMDEAAGQATAKVLGGSFVRLNVTKKSEVDAVAAEITRQNGALDILVNNAGIVHAADFLELKEADFDRVLRVNLKGAFLMGQAVAKKMVARVKGGGRPGAIVNMSSVNAEMTIPNQTAYNVSKGGVGQLTRNMAVALAPYGIRVNAIGPGSIMTEMMRAVAADEAARRMLLSRTPLLRFGEPAEVAAIAVFLASEESSYITGETIFCDGGRRALNYVVKAPE